LPYLRTVVTGAPETQDVYCEWQRRREIEEAGVILVRPDGVVAWRHSADLFDAKKAKDLLVDALSKILNKKV
ncbi:MAG: 2,4-dichlorophenol 6-monooxygenase, partial [Proteobacteria bacterium]|nr:2,4-dichlorophenol 6-monooxygenase [Pseudomonadota bacterium]